MHSAGIVIGDNLEKQLFPFSTAHEAKPFKKFLDEEELKSMAKHYGIDPSNLKDLREKMKDWCGEEGFIENGTLGYWSKENKNAKFDWHQIGGQYKDSLKLKKPKKSILSFFGKLSKTHVHQARLSELDPEHLKAQIPVIVVKNGEWFEDSIPLIDSFQGAQSEQWKQFYHDLLTQLPQDILITVVDFHS